MKICQKSLIIKNRDIYNKYTKYQPSTTNIKKVMMSQRLLVIRKSPNKENVMLKFPFMLVCLKKVQKLPASYVMPSFASVESI
jgi:hypothetical protein